MLKISLWIKSGKRSKSRFYCVLLVIVLFLKNRESYMSSVFTKTLPSTCSISLKKFDKIFRIKVSRALHTHRHTDTGFYLSILIKFSVVGLSVCPSVCVFHSGDFIFKAIYKFFFHLLEQTLGSVLVKSEFKYLM